MRQLGNFKKWEEYYQNYKVTPSRQATVFLTAKNTLELLKNIRKGRVLDIGCGFGEIDILLAQNSDFDITGCDISKTAIETARENVRKAGLEKQIKIEESDVYNLKYPDNYFDVILSFGYASAATYPGVQKEVARILKPEGILICDFINCLSLYKVLDTTKRIILGKSPYYLTIKGIQQDFGKAGLYYLEQRFFNTYPPLDFVMRISPKAYLMFENTFGRIFKRILARVRLVSFIKKI